jgi:hypothetical protein
MTCPVTLADNGLSRYVTRGAIRSATDILVHARGHTAFTRTSKSTRSIAHDTPFDATAPFDAECVPAPRCPNSGSDAMLTIAPLPRARRLDGRRAAVQRTEHVDVDERAHPVGVLGPRRRRVPEAGVVDQAVDSAELVDALGDQRLGRVRICPGMLAGPWRFRRPP